MALTTVETSSPFAKVDKQMVIGTLKSVGSNDPDMLYAQKQKLLGPLNNLKKASYVIMGAGALLTITVVAAFTGIPFALFGFWMYKHSSKNIAILEEAYGEYLAAHRA